MSSEFEHKDGELKYHYYNLYFVYGGVGVVHHNTMYFGDTEKDVKITIPVLDALKKKGNIHEDACLVSVSYLGFMTQKELNEGVDD